MHPGIAGVCAIHNLSLAVAYGGPIFAKKALLPAAMESLSSPAERGKLMQCAWSRFDKINLAAHAAFSATWLIERKAIRRIRSDRTYRLVALKDLVIMGALVTGLANHLTGDRMHRDFPEGVSYPAGDLSAEKAAKLAKYHAYYRVMGPINVALIGASIALGPALAISVLRANRRGLLGRLLGR